MWILAIGCGGQAPEGLRLMTFNIEYGGDVVDFQRIVDAAEAADADVIAINEAWESTERLANALGWAWFDPRTDVISRYPLVEPPEADGAYTFVEVEPARVVAIANVHLPSDPYGPDAVIDGAPPAEVLALETSTRLPAVEPLLDVLPGVAAQGIPTYLVGDFNTPSHRDWTEEAVGERPHLRYALEWPVTAAVEAAGFVDSYREIHPDPVADPGLTWWADRPGGYPLDGEPEDRIDFVFALGPTPTLASEVVGEAGSDLVVRDWGSDHRAVVSTFDAAPGDMPTLIAVTDRLVVAGQPLDVRFHADAASAVAAVPAGGGPEAALETVPTGSADGRLEVDTAALAVGAYELLLLDGDTIVSRCPFYVQPSEDAVLLTTDAAVYGVGDPITARWENGPGNRWDWIGLYAAPGDPYDYFLGYNYTGSEVEGAAVFDASAPAIDWPLPPGDYELLYLLNDGYTAAATAAFSVE